MKRWTQLLFLETAVLTLSGCQSNSNSSAASSSKPKTVARSNQYSQKQLASFYNQISEAVIAPLKDLHYGVSQDHLKTTLTTQQKKLSAIGLKLANNTAQQQATQDLGNYTKTAQSVLTAMKNNDQNSFTAAMKSFNNETNSIAKRDFSNQIPQSFRDYITLEKQDQSISSVATSSSQK